MLRKGDHWFAIEGERYAARWDGEAPSRLRIDVEGRCVLRVPLISGLHRVDEQERLDFEGVEGPRAENGCVTLRASAASSLWDERRFEWRFFPDRIELRHEGAGRGRVGRCAYLGLGGQSTQRDTWVDAADLYSPQQNFAGQSYHATNEPAAAHAMQQQKSQRTTARSIDYAFYPPPFFLAFGRRDEERWLGVGLGAEPGCSHFTGLLYSGDANRGTGWLEVDYQGYLHVDRHFRSPALVLVPGYQPHELLRDYVSWLEAQGLVPSRRGANAEWHRRPIFCGWGEQVCMAVLQGIAPPVLATQACYEDWLARLDQLELPAGTVVIDDKWMAHYGRWDIDREKWPDLSGFIARQHARGRRVLLWLPYWHHEGVPVEQCLRADGEPIQADVSHPAQQALVRERVRDLVGNVGADGFKLDWIFAPPNRPDLEMHEPLWGVERIHRLQALVYDAAHDEKPDALIQTQTPNPLFRDCSDMIRLNDLGYGMRDVVRVMRERARIAHIAGWSLVDCDNASSTGLAEWREYMLAQPEIGVPSLYCLSRMESTLECIPDDDWPAIRRRWREYLARELGETA